MLLCVTTDTIINHHCMLLICQVLYSLNSHNKPVGQRPSFLFTKIVETEAQEVRELASGPTAGQWSNGDVNSQGF